jgi:hypothetical protein
MGTCGRMRTRKYGSSQEGELSEHFAKRPTASAAPRSSFDLYIQTYRELALCSAQKTQSLGSGEMD